MFVAFEILGHSHEETLLVGETLGRARPVSRRLQRGHQNGSQDRDDGDDDQKFDEREAPELHLSAAERYLCVFYSFFTHVFLLVIG